MRNKTGITSPYTANLPHASSNAIFSIASEAGYGWNLYTSDAMTSVTRGAMKPNPIAAERMPAAGNSHSTARIVSLTAQAHQKAKMLMLDNCRNIQSQGWCTKV